MIRTSKKKGNDMGEGGGRASLAWKENLRISPVACYKKKPRMGILIATYSPSRVTLEKAVLVAGRIAIWRSPGNFFSQTQSPCSRRLRDSVLKASKCKEFQGAPISTDPVTQNTCHKTEYQMQAAQRMPTGIHMFRRQLSQSQ